MDSAQTRCSVVTVVDSAHTQVQCNAQCTHPGAVKFTAHTPRCSVVDNAHTQVQCSGQRTQLVILLSRIRFKVNIFALIHNYVYIIDS